MTLQPVAPPHPLTVAEYLAIGEIEPGYSELVEGQLLMCASPRPSHNRAAFRFGGQLERWLPANLEIIVDIDVDLELVAPGRPGFVRRPDLIVVRREASARVDRAGDAIRASEVEIIIEIVSPSTHRTDYVTKRGEYADAGVPYYWIVDLEPPVSILTCHQAGDFGYADSGEVTGTYRTRHPFPMTIDLDALP